MQNIFCRFEIAFIDINRVGHRLKRVKADTDREDEEKIRQINDQIGTCITEKM